jgi:hypothetical protein
VSQAWIEIVGNDGVRRRHTLREGLTTVGGKRGDVVLGETGNDQLHIWDRPPKLVFVGGGEPPRVRGQAVEELALHSGDVIEWRGLRIEFAGLAYAQLEEVPLPVEAPAMPVVAPPVATWSSADEQVWRRLKAGLLVELGIADADTTRRWQDAVLRTEFEPDSCARDLLAASKVDPGDPRLLERSARLQRDLLMSPMARGTRGGMRKLRSTTSNWLAMAISQLVVLAVFVLLFLVALFVVRIRWSVSVDAYLDRVAESIRGD